MTLALDDIVGVSAAFCSMASFAPQILKIWKDGDAASISVTMYLVTVSAFVLWTAYGVLIGSWPVVGSNLICLVLSATILEMVWRLRHRKSGRGSLPARRRRRGTREPPVDDRTPSPRRTQDLDHPSRWFRRQALGVTPTRRRKSLVRWA